MPPEEQASSSFLGMCGKLSSLIYFCVHFIPVPYQNRRHALERERHSEIFKAAGTEVDSTPTAVALGVVPAAAPLGKRLGLSCLERLAYLHCPQAWRRGCWGVGCLRFSSGGAFPAWLMTSAALGLDSCRKMTESFTLLVWLQQVSWLSWLSWHL